MQVTGQGGKIIQIFWRQIAQGRLPFHNGLSGDRCADEPSKMITWQRRLGDLKKDISGEVFLGPSRKAGNSQLVKQWSGCVVSSFVNYMKASRKKEYNFTFPAAGPLMDQLIAQAMASGVAIDEITPPATLLQQEKNFQLLFFLLGSSIVEKDQV